jgi:hypothetical protein
MDGAAFLNSASYQRITAGNSLGFPNVAVEAWVNFADSSGGNYPRVFDIQDGSYSGQLIWDAGNTNYWTTKSSYYESGYNSTEWPVTPSTGTWYHVVVVWGPSSAQFYINGVAQSSGGLGGITGVGSNPNTLYVGIRGDGNSITAFHGAIQEVRTAAGGNISAAWVAHTYRQQSQSGAWYTMGGWVAGQTIMAATATMSGSAARKTSKSSAASIATMAGSMMRGRSLPSSLAAMAGSTGRATARALAASVAAFAAALLAAHLRFSALTASLASMSGVLYRQVARSLASGTATLGAVFTAARVARTFTQALMSSAAAFSASFSTAHRVLTSLAASMSTLAGSVTKQIQKSFGAN